MALDTLSTTIPAGPDKIAGRSTAQGFVEAVMNVAADGSEIIDPDAGDQVLSYNGDGTLNFIETTLATGVYRQTFGYAGGKVVSISKWVKQ